MSNFTSPCRIEIIGNNLFKTIEPFEYHVGEYPSNEVIHVPIGLKTDFASVPRFFWPVISPIDSHAKAALIHDFMYQNYYDEKLRCDEIFKEALQVLNVPKWKMFFLYYGVKFFGFYAWNKYRRLDNVV
jgi:hypothetical protein